MIATSKSLLQLVAEDIMSHPVEVIPQNMSLRAVAHMLSQSQITGAPVVDQNGRCVGVISATDFLHWADQGGQSDRRTCSTAPCVCTEWQEIDMASIPQDQVRWHMTTDPVTVAPSTKISELARMMIDAHIHRVFVVDQEHRPTGIVTTTDILAAVARSEQEE